MPAAPTASAKQPELCKISDDEIIVNVQGDEPLIPPKVIKNVAELLMNRSDCSMGTAAIRIHSAEGIL